MFGLGFWELALIVLAVIVFVKPKDLPGLFFKIGRMYGELQGLTRSVRGMMRSIEEEEEAARGHGTAGARGTEAGDPNRPAAPDRSDTDEKE